MKQIFFGLFGAALIALSPWAQARDFTLGAKIGTLGLGAEGTMPLGPTVNARAGINDYTYDFAHTSGGVGYEFELDLRSYALLFDWHPYQGVFRLSAGYLYNRNGMNMTATPTTPVNIGGVIFQPSEVGTVRGNVSFRKLVPYLGIGWGTAPTASKGFTVTGEVGLMFQGDPDVRLSSDGTLANDPAFQSDLRAEEREVREDLAGLKTYPVLSVGVSYRF